MTLTVRNIRAALISKHAGPVHSVGKHYGPGPHDSGSSQDVHGDDDDGADYRGSHQPSPSYGAPAHDLTQLVADDIYTHPEYYPGAEYRETVDMIRRVRNNPSADVVVYRAVPGGVNDDINPGDWVTPSREYAKLHGESNLGEGYQILERTVKARELVWPGDYLPEWGWFPKNVFTKRKILAALISKHAAPIHPGTGTSQDVHSGGGLTTETWEGVRGDRSHLTRKDRGNISTSAIADLPGKMGEVPGQHRHMQGADWETFKADIAERGIIEPIFIVVDPDEGPLIYEGNHRRDAAVELGLEKVPVEIRYFGQAEWVAKHAAPIHPGTGTDQSVHGGMTITESPFGFFIMEGERQVGYGKTKEKAEALRRWKLSQAEKSKDYLARYGFDPYQDDPPPEIGEALITDPVRLYENAVHSWKGNPDDMSRNMGDIVAGTDKPGVNSNIKRFEDRNMARVLLDRIEHSKPVDYIIYRAQNSFPKDMARAGDPRLDPGDVFEWRWAGGTPIEDEALYHVSTEHALDAPARYLFVVQPGAHALPIDREMSSAFRGEDEHLMSGKFRILSIRDEKRRARAGDFTGIPMEGFDVDVTIVEVEQVKHFVKHAAPIHPGTGSDQSVHGDRGGNKLSPSDVSTSMTPMHTTSGKKSDNPPISDLDLIASGRTMAEYRHLQVRAAWDSLPELTGDRVYWTRPEMLDGLRGELKRLNKRSEKYLGNKDPLAIVELPRTHAHTTSDGRVLGFVAIQIEGTPPHAPGYEFIAKLEHLKNEDGSYTNILKSVPGYDGEIPVEYRTAGPNCDVCKRNIYRKDTFLVKETATGKIIQAGRDDLALYTGYSEAEQLANFTSSYADFVSQLEEGGGEGRDGYGERAGWPVLDTLAITSSLTRKEGFVPSRSWDGNTTKDQLRGLLMKPRHSLEQWEKDLLPEDQDYEKADKVIEWLSTLDDEALQSDYMWNLKVAATNPYGADERQLGILASAVNAYDREMGLRVERARQVEVDSVSEFVGQIKERREFPNLTVSRHNSFEGNYGTTHVYEFVDPDNNSLVWFASNPIEYKVQREMPQWAINQGGYSPEEFYENVAVEIGDVIDLKATVKDHKVDTYNDRNRKQTVITRGQLLARREGTDAKTS